MTSVAATPIRARRLLAATDFLEIPFTCGGEIDSADIALPSSLFAAAVAAPPTMDVASPCREGLTRRSKNAQRRAWLRGASKQRKPRQRDSSRLATVVRLRARRHALLIAVAATAISSVVWGPCEPTCRDWALEPAAEPSVRNDQIGQRASERSGARWLSACSRTATAPKRFGSFGKSELTRSSLSPDSAPDGDSTPPS